MCARLLLHQQGCTTRPPGCSGMAASPQTRHTGILTAGREWEQGIWGGSRAARYGAAVRRTGRAPPAVQARAPPFLSAWSAPHAGSPEQVCSRLEGREARALVPVLAPLCRWAAEGRSKCAQPTARPARFINGAPHAASRPLSGGSGGQGSVWAAQAAPYGAVCRQQATQKDVRTLITATLEPRPQVELNTPGWATRLGRRPLAAPAPACLPPLLAADRRCHSAATPIGADPSWLPLQMPPPWFAGCAATAA